MPNRFEAPINKTGPVLEQLNNWRAGQINEKLARMGIHSKLPNDVIVQYLAEMDPKIIQRCPLVTSMRDLIPPVSFKDRLWKNLLHQGPFDETGFTNERVELMREGTMQANEVAVLRSISLLLHITEGASPKVMLDYIKETLAEHAVIDAGKLGCTLPAAWTASIDRQRITQLFGLGYESPAEVAVKTEMDDELIDEDDLQEQMGELGVKREEAIMLMKAVWRDISKSQHSSMHAEDKKRLAAYLETHPDPAVLAGKLLSIDQLELLTKIAAEKPVA